MSADQQTEDQQMNRILRDSLVHGWIFIDKPAGMTSTAVITQIKGALIRTFHLNKKQFKIGHCGTLDPFASGILVIACGNATKLSQYFLLLPKTYICRIIWGYQTDTLDCDGKRLKKSSEQSISSGIPLTSALINNEDNESMYANNQQYTFPMNSPQSLQQAPQQRVIPSKNAIKQALQDFIALQDYRQQPPQYSAVKLYGVRSYDKAREGGEFSLLPRKTRIFNAHCIKELDILGKQAFSDILLTVQSGFYVRSFARDFAKHLGTYAYLEQLRRVSYEGLKYYYEAHRYTYENHQYIDENSQYDQCNKERLESVAQPLSSLFAGSRPSRCQHSVLSLDDFASAIAFKDLTKIITPIEELGSILPQEHLTSAIEKEKFCSGNMITLQKKECKGSQKEIKEQTHKTLNECLVIDHTGIAIGVGRRTYDDEAKVTLLSPIRVYSI